MLAAIFYAIADSIFSITDKSNLDLLVFLAAVLGLIVPIVWLRHKRKKYRRVVPSIIAPYQVSLGEADARINSQAMQEVNEQLAALSAEVTRLRMERDAAEEMRLKAEREGNEARQRTQPQALLEEGHPQLPPSAYERPPERRSKQRDVSFPIVLGICFVLLFLGFVVAPIAGVADKASVAWFCCVIAFIVFTWWAQFKLQLWWRRMEGRSVARGFRDEYDEN